MRVSFARAPLAPGGYIQAGLSSRISSSDIDQTGMPSPPRPPESPLPRDRVPERAHMAACPSPLLTETLSTLVRWLADWQTSSISTAGGGEGFGDTISIDPKIYGKPRASLLPSTHSHPPYPPMLPARRRRSRACLPRIPPCARPPALACMFGGCTVSFVTRIVA